MSGEEISRSWTSGSFRRSTRGSARREVLSFETKESTRVRRPGVGGGMRVRKELCVTVVFWLLIHSSWMRTRSAFPEAVSRSECMALVDLLQLCTRTRSFRDVVLNIRLWWYLEAVHSSVLVYDGRLWRWGEHCWVVLFVLVGVVVVVVHFGVLSALPAGVRG